jgi:UDP-N-acetylmuramate dehydrogenase
MPEIFEYYSLKNHNTFGLEVTSRYFFEAASLNDLLAFFKGGLKPRAKFMIIGEGSNILFRADYDGTIVHPALKGIAVLKEDADIVTVKASAGENWDEFVKYCVLRNWSGLQNLSLIPGSVGSSPVQNIGAYGVEAKDRIHEVEGFFIETGKAQTFTNPECRFGYRNSIFKQELKNRFLITAVTFILDKHPQFELSYGPVQKEFHKKPVHDLASLRQTIIEIRESKLPDPSKLGNAGSFFKNPIILNSDFKILQSRFPEIPSYPAGKETTKIPAAWLIERAGWKGIREGDTGTYPTQPLVIVNYGNASGKEIYAFAGKIINSVRRIFGITLEMEVNLV